MSAGSPRNDDPPVLFIHIAKTAGGTLRQLAARSVGRAASYPDTSVDPEGSYRNSERLVELPAERLRSLRLISGHFPFSVAGLLPIETRTALPSLGRNRISIRWRSSGSSVISTGWSPWYATDSAETRRPRTTTYRENTRCPHRSEQSSRRPTSWTSTFASTRSPRDLDRRRPAATGGDRRQYCTRPRVAVPWWYLRERLSRPCETTST